MTTEKLDEQAREILRSNDRGGYTVPTSGLYPYQWNWDSGFAAWGFSTYDVHRAWFEMETLFVGQWDNGMVPHIIFHRKAFGYFPGPDVWGVPKTPYTSGITQPPVATTFIRAIYEADKYYGRVRLELMYSRLVAWHRWFIKNRLEDGAVVVTHPWESGRDNAPDWDEAMQNVDTSEVEPYVRVDTKHVNPEMRPKKEDYDRYLAIVQFGRDCGWDEATIRKHGPFRVADIGTTCIFLRACRDLKAIAEELDHETDEIRGWIKTLESGVKGLWNEEHGHYDSRDVRTGKLTNTLSSASFLCWYAGVNDERMVAQLERVLGKVEYGVPSCDPEHPHFNPLRYWRGPVWGVVNTLIGLGLEETGHTELAERVRQDTRRLIVEDGFFEYFDPIDGRSAGGDHFTWTAAIWLAWASPSAKGRL